MLWRFGCLLCRGCQVGTFPAVPINSVMFSSQNLTLQVCEVLLYMVSKGIGYCYSYLCVWVYGQVEGHLTCITNARTLRGFVLFCFVHWVSQHIKTVPWVSYGWDLQLEKHLSIQFMVVYQVPYRNTERVCKILHFCTFFLGDVVFTPSSILLSIWFLTKWEKLFWNVSIGQIRPTEIYMWIILFYKLINLSL